MRTLYVSDLDGTLLRSDAKTSEYTNSVINCLTSKGVLFSYATARSYSTASKVTEGLDAKIPVITYNGAVILENGTRTVISKNAFSKEEKDEILGGLIGCGVYPIVYSYIAGEERFSYILGKCGSAAAEFLSTRKGDRRDNPVATEGELRNGEVFYFTCIGGYERLEPLYKRFKDKYRCFFQRDIYSGEQWLELVPMSVSKANAVRQLKEYVGADRVVAFGDGVNDIEMFEAADEAYAVENATEELKSIATGIIGGNDHDGVARWMWDRLGENKNCIDQTGGS